MTLLLYLAIFFAVTAVVVQGLNLLIGDAGLLVFVTAGLQGVGAYAYAITTARFDWNPWLALLLVVPTTGAVAGWLCAAAVTRVRGDALVFGSIALQVAVTSAFLNLTPITGGPYGHGASPLGEPTLLPIAALVLGVAVFAYHHRLLTGPLGQVIRSTRDDALAATALGYDVTVYRRTAFSVAGATMALGGGLHAAHLLNVDVASFTLGESLSLAVAVIIGGAGTFKGALTGASILVLLPEVLRLFSFGPAEAPVRQIIYGSLLVLLMRVRPRGLFGRSATA